MRNVIGPVARSHRQRQKITLQTVCDRLAAQGIDIDTGNLSRWERGQQALPDYKVQAIAEAIHTSVSDLYEQSGATAAVGFVSRAAPAAISVDEASADAYMTVDTALATEPESAYVEILPSNRTVAIRYVAESGDRAMLVQGNALMPRYRHGEVVLIAAGKPEPGDDVLLEPEDGPPALVRYLFTRDGESHYSPIATKGPARPLISPSDTKASPVLAIFQRHLFF